MKGITSLIVICLFLTSFVYAEEIVSSVPEKPILKSTNSGEEAKPIIRNVEKENIKKGVGSIEEKKGPIKAIISRRNKGITSLGKIDNCITRLVEKEGIKKEEAYRRCRYRILRAKPIKERIRVVRKVDNFLDIKKGEIEEKIKECKDEECKKKLEDRLGKIEKLDKKLGPIFNRIEEKRLEKLNEIKELKEKEGFSKFRGTLNLKARAINNIMLEKAKKNFIEAKKRFERAKTRYLDARKRFLEKKKLIGACKDNESDECKKAKEEIIEDSKEYLIGIADQMIEYINKIEAKVESNDDLSEEEVNQIIENLDEWAKEVEELKVKIEGAEDKEDIKEAAKKLSEYWKRIKYRLEIKAARIVNARIGGIIIRSKYLEIKLNRILDRLAEDGVDISEIETLVDKFNAKIEEAKKLYEKARKSFKEAALLKREAGEKTEEEIEKIKELSSAGHEAMKGAQRALNEAQKTLRDIIIKIKNIGREDVLEKTSIGTGEIEKEISREEETTE